MTTALETYKAKRQAAQDAEAFAAMLSGGTVGAHCLLTIVNRSGAEIDMPESMVDAVSDAVASRAAAVLTAAVNQLKQEALTAGLAARDEYLNLLQADGIITQGG